MAYHESRDSSFQASRGSEQMAGHRLGRGDDERTGVSSEGLLDSQRLEAIVVRRGRCRVR